MRFRVVYMGTPDFAVPPLEALLGGPDEVVAVITNPDRRSGRGRKMTPPPVKVAALEAGVPVLQPKSARTDAFVEELAALEADLAIVVAYGKILPQRVLDVPRLGCINVHASILPRLRGAAPINWALVRGHAETGVSIMQMDAGMDTGPVYAIASTPIGESETAGELHDRLMHLGPPLLMEVLQGIADGEATATPQDDDAATRAPMISKSDGLIDWRQPAQAVVNHIHGFNPWPGSSSTVASSPDADLVGQRIKFHRAEAAEPAGVDLASCEPGEILRAPEGLFVKAGEGAVKILECQAPGRRAMAADDFLNGCPMPAGSHFQRLDRD